MLKELVTHISYNADGDNMPPAMGVALNAGGASADVAGGGGGGVAFAHDHHNTHGSRALGSPTITPSTPPAKPPIYRKYQHQTPVIPHTASPHNPTWTHTHRHPRQHMVFSCGLMCLVYVWVVFI